jgi:hypothetical protein
MPGYPFDAKFLSQREIRQDFAGRFVFARMAPFAARGTFCRFWPAIQFERG